MKHTKYTQIHLYMKILLKTSLFVHYLKLGLRMFRHGRNV